MVRNSEEGRLMRPCLDVSYDGNFTENRNGISFNMFLRVCY